MTVSGVAAPLAEDSAWHQKKRVEMDLSAWNLKVWASEESEDALERALEDEHERAAENELEDVLERAAEVQLEPEVGIQVPEEA